MNRSEVLTEIARLQIEIDLVNPTDVDPDRREARKRKLQELKLLEAKKKENPDAIADAIRRR